MNIFPNTQINHHDKYVAIWLLSCCLVIFGMVVLGGVTRLTGSGLSMVEWQPVLGILPPLSVEQWQATFELYQLSPEFLYKNSDMTMTGFKSIFWFEYAHRLLGRSIGLIFFLPMLYFILKGQVTKNLSVKLLLMFVLGGLQGLLGWYMVKSGLVNDPHVSQYRLTAHLGLAFVIYAYIFWVALSLLLPKSDGMEFSKNNAFSMYSLVLTLMVFVTVLSGGLVAGTKAGYAFNTFPLMDGRLIPDGLFHFDPLWRNFFENIMTIQFDHRLLAMIVLILISILWVQVRRKMLPMSMRFAVNLLLVAVLLQVVMGISTLLFRVPVFLAVTHQAGALLLLTVTLYVLYVFRSQPSIRSSHSVVFTRNSYGNRKYLSSTK